VTSSCVREGDVRCLFSKIHETCYSEEKGKMEHASSRLIFSRRNNRSQNAPVRLDFLERNWVKEKMLMIRKG